MSKMLVVCPKCYTFFSTQQSKRALRCDKCAVELESVDFDYYRYEKMSDQEKKNFKHQYVWDHYHVERGAERPAPFHPMAQSGWVGFMGCCGWFTVIGLLIAGILCSVLGSFAIGIALMISAPISGGALILFSIVAEDVRHIRNQVDKLHYDRDHQ